MNMSDPLITSNHDQIDPLKKLTLVLCWLLYHQAAMQPAPSPFLSTAHWGCIFLVSNCLDLLYKGTFMVHVPWPLHFSLSLELAYNTWTEFCVFFFMTQSHEPLLTKTRRGFVGQALWAHQTTGTPLPVRGQPCFMMRHEISTAGIFVLKPSRKEVRHVKTGCAFFFLPFFFFFFFFLKKTEDTEKQQLGQIRRKNHKHVPLSWGPDLSAAALL